MKELVLKKRLELEEVCKSAHLEPDANTAADKLTAVIDAGIYWTSLEIETLAGSALVHFLGIF